MFPVSKSFVIKFIFIMKLIKNLQDFGLMCVRYLYCMSFDYSLSCLCTSYIHNSIPLNRISNQCLHLEENYKPTFQRPVFSTVHPSTFQIPSTWRYLETHVTRVSALCLLPLTFIPKISHRLSCTDTPAPQIHPFYTFYNVVPQPKEKCSKRK